MGCTLHVISRFQSGGRGSATIAGQFVGCCPRLPRLAPLSGSALRHQLTHSGCVCVRPTATHRVPAQSYSHPCWTRPTTWRPRLALQLQLRADVCRQPCVRRAAGPMAVCHPLRRRAQTGRLHRTVLAQHASHVGQCAPRLPCGRLPARPSPAFARPQLLPPTQMVAALLHPPPAQTMSHR